VPIDIDGDGRDEIQAGFAMLNTDGTLRWVFQSHHVDLRRGHLDCMRVLRAGKTPADFRLALTCCGALNLAVVDGCGKPIWELSGQHFEAINVGKIRADVPGLQIAVDIDHRPAGQGPLWVVDENGRRLAEVVTSTSRHHVLVDWTGNGALAILIAGGRGLFDGHGRRIATLSMNPGDSPGIGMVADMDGDGVPDVLLTNSSASAVYIYRNEKGRRPTQPVPLGTGVNFTLY
jgi:hypothetical protein